MRLIHIVTASISIGLLMTGCSQKTEATAAQPAEPAASLSIGTTQPVPANALPAQLKVIGTESFWSIDIEGDRLHYTTMDDPTGHHLVAEPKRHNGDGWQWRSEPVGAFDLIIQPSKCSDGMSDREYDYAALFVFGEATYSGCADVLEKFLGEGQ